MNELAKERIRSYRVGMAETDTRRHYYYTPGNTTQLDYHIRVCDWEGVYTPVVFIPAAADCKNCLRIKEIAEVT